MSHNYDYDLAALTLGQAPQQLPCLENAHCPPGWICVGGNCVPPAGLPGLPPGFVAPGGVEVRPENWDLDAKPFATYAIAMGDTLVGLAATYLGDGARWTEIYDTGSNRAQFPNPSALNHPGPLDMPHEARDNMKKWLQKGKPLTPPGEMPPPTIAEKAKKNWPWLVGGAAAAVGFAVLAGR